MATKLTVISLAIIALVVGWTIRPAEAHTGDPCPHSQPNHPHCMGGGGGSGDATALRIVDVNGQFVGFPIQIISNRGFQVLRKIPALGSKPFLLDLDTGGFRENPQIQFLYTSNNCTGLRYVQAYFGHDVPDPSMFNDGYTVIAAGQLAIAAAPFQQINVTSMHIYNLVTNTQVGSCYDWSSTPQLYNVGTLDFVDLYSTLGVQAPFRVE